MGRFSSAAMSSWRAWTERSDGARSSRGSASGCWFSGNGGDLGRAVLGPASSCCVARSRESRSDLRRVAELALVRVEPVWWIAPRESLEPVLALLDPLRLLRPVIERDVCDCTSVRNGQMFQEKMNNRQKDIREDRVNQVGRSSPQTTMCFPRPKSLRSCGFMPQIVNS